MARGAAGGERSKAKKGGRRDEEAQEGESAAKVGWADNVDRLLDASPGFVTALRAAFIRFEDPKSASIPPSSLLPALQLFFQRALEELDPRAGKLFFRPVTRDDLDAVAEEDPSLDIDQPADIEDFGAIAKKIARRVFVDRGKRLGLFVIGGVVVVHVVKGIAKQLPFLGPAVGVFLGLVPTMLVGPAVGAAAALYSGA
eukprot:c15028_g1_i1 orf=158-754(+)